VPYLPDYHAESDTFDKVDAREAHVNAAIASALAWGLAERRDLPLQRQSRSAVEKLIVDYKLESQMRAFGQWEEWGSGKRGFDSNVEEVEGGQPAAKP
jgi:redox-regulated HSP33 family molecular chaperone